MYAPWINDTVRRDSFVLDYMPKGVWKLCKQYLILQLQNMCQFNMALIHPEINGLVYLASFLVNNY